MINSASSLNGEVRVHADPTRHEGSSAMTTASLAIGPMVGSGQHVGARTEQQDYFLLPLSKPAELVGRAGWLYIVCDGMGGHAHGDAASMIAARAFRDAYEQIAPGESIPEALRRAAVAANAVVVEKNASLGGRPRSMGTTLVGVVVLDDALYHVSIGDSPFFLFRDGQLLPCNAMHTLAEDLEDRLAAGLISEEEAASHPQADALTSFIGQPTLKLIDCPEQPRMLQTDDRILIATDGLTKFLDAAQIVATLGKPIPPQDAVDYLIDQVLAKKREDQDNITLVLIDHGTAPLRAATAPVDMGSEPPVGSPNALVLALGISIAITLLLIFAVIVFVLVMRGQSPAAPLLTPGDAVEVPQDPAHGEPAPAQDLENQEIIEPEDVLAIEPPEIPPSSLEDISRDIPDLGTVPFPRHPGPSRPALPEIGTIEADRATEEGNDR
jgi:serine/threonine protein phosphatase PrpC